MGVLVQGVQQALPLAAEQRLPMQQHAHGLERLGFAAGEEFRPVEAQQAVLAEFGAVQQQPLARADQQHPARRRLLAEDLLAEALLPVRRIGAKDSPRKRGVAQCLELFGLDAAGERIQVRLFAHGRGGFQDPEHRIALAGVQRAQQRQLDNVIEQLTARPIRQLEDV